MPPSDTEEADASHRRFLPVKAQQDRTINVIMKLSESSVDHDQDNNCVPEKSETPDYAAIPVEDGKAGFTSEEPTISAGIQPEQTFGFDCSFLKRFFQLHRLLFLNCCSISSILFGFLVCLVLLQEYIVYQVGLIASGFYKTLGEKDLEGFWIQTSHSLGLIFAVAFVKSTTQFVQKVLSVTFRKLLCQASHRLYFSDIRFYQLNCLDRCVDNPDQRMTQDIDKFCTTYCEVLPKLIVSPFTIGYYCYQGYQRSGWQGPVGCFGFFLLATSVNRILMSPIVNYVVKQERREGDFRFLHMLVRVSSESIAFQDASVTEHKKIEDSLQKLVDTQHALYLRQYFLSFTTNFFDYIGSIFSYLMLAIPIFSGRYNHLSPADLGYLISQNAFILIYLIYTFTSLVDLSGKFTDVAGVTHRVSQLLERLNALGDFWKDLYPETPEQDQCGSMDGWGNARRNIRKRSENPKYIDETDDGTKKLLIWELKDVSFSAPNLEEPLISRLSVNFSVGESVLITGTSSAGKTSILRILRGLWPYSEGVVKRHFPPGPQSVYFCPQKAYLTWGTLREQISFPLHPDEHGNSDRILYYLDKLKLGPIVERVGGLDVACSWSVYDSLSPGEMQRICLLRVFYHQPVVAVLDEITCALPFDMEDFVYSELKRLGITLISVGHRESIRKYHDKQLVINSKGGWAVYPIIHED